MGHIMTALDFRFVCLFGGHTGWYSGATLDSVLCGGVGESLWTGSKVHMVPGIKLESPAGKKHVLSLHEFDFLIWWPPSLVFWDQWSHGFWDPWERWFLTEAVSCGHGREVSLTCGAHCSNIEGALVLKKLGLLTQEIGRFLKESLWVSTINGVRRRRFRSKDLPCGSGPPFFCIGSWSMLESQAGSSCAC